MEKMFGEGTQGLKRLAMVNRKIILLKNRKKLSFTTA